MRALARLLTCPLMCLLWAAAMFLDWSSLPNDSAASSVAGRHRPFHRLINFPRYRGFDSCPLPPDPPLVIQSGLPLTYADYAGAGELFFVCRMPAGLVAISARGSAALPQSALVGFVVVSGDTGSRYQGFWAPTSAVVRMRTGNTANSFAAADRAELPKAIFAAVEAFRGDEHIHPIDYWLLRAAQSSRTIVTPYGDRSGILAVSSTPLLSGYAHNAVAAGVGVLFIAGIVRNLRRAFGRYSKRGRRARGLCPSCSYDLKGEFEGGCPECGWNRKADKAAVDEPSMLKKT